MTQASTRGPWEWRKVGKRWVLWGAHGMRPIVLDNYRGEMRVRDDHGASVMVPFDPEHPDARLIEAAPDILAAAKAVLDWLEAAGVMPPTLLGKLAAAIAKAEASPATGPAGGNP